MFARRLQKGMLLQTDPTVIYGLGNGYDGNIRKRDLTTDTPYNTYTRPGLPPTPIAMPGRAALQAAVNPAAGDALYFVARNDGSHIFSATYAEHNAAVDCYQRRRCPAGVVPGQGTGRSAAAMSEAILTHSRFVSLKAARARARAPRSPRCAMRCSSAATKWC